MSLGQRSVDIDRSCSSEVTPTGFLGLVAVPAAEQQVGAECEFKHIACGIGLAAHEDGVAIGNIMCIFNYIVVAFLGKFPVGETVDGAHMGGPLVDYLYVFLCEFLDGGCTGFGILDLADCNLKAFGNIAPLDYHLTLTSITLVGSTGDLNGDITSLAGRRIDCNPALACGCCPCLLGGELGLPGLLFAIEVEFLGIKSDVGHVDTVEVVVDSQILGGIPHILFDVVLEQIIVEANHYEEHTHGGDGSGIITEINHSFALAELLEVANGWRVEQGVAGKIPAQCMGYELDGTRQGLGEVDDGTVAGILIPRISVETCYS